MPEDDPIIDLEVRADGSIRFEVCGVPGEGCEEFERLVLEALRGEVLDRGYTSEFYQRVADTVAAGLDALLRRG